MLSGLSSSAPRLVPDAPGSDGPADHPTPEPPRRSFETVLAAGGLALLLVLLWTMQAPPSSFLNPALVAAAGAIMLWPLRRQRPIRAILYAGAFLLACWLAVQLTWILVPFVLVYLLAYLFDPLVSDLRHRIRLPRWVSSLLVTTLVVSVVILFALLLVPNILNQLETLGARLLASMGDLRGWLATAPWLDSLEDANLIQKQEFIDQVTTTLQEQLSLFVSSLPDATEGILQSISSVLEVLVMVAITPVLLFYTLKDYPYLKRQLTRLFPTFGGRRDYLVHASGIVGNYLRGQLTISAIAALNVTIALLLFDVPFALLIGLLGGLLNMIPTLGILLTNIVGVLLAIIFGDPWLVDVIIVVAVLGAQSLLEQTVLTPNILSYQVGLHPVLILLSLFVFGYFLGVIGLIVAVPVTALVVTAYETYRSTEAGLLVAEPAGARAAPPAADAASA